EALEIVDVDHDQRHPAVAPAGALDLLIQEGPEMTVIVHAGHAVQLGEPAGGQEQALGLDRHRGHVGAALQDLEVLRIEGVPAPATGNRRRSERAITSRTASRSSAPAVAAAISMKESRIFRSETPEGSGRGWSRAPSRARHQGSGTERTTGAGGLPPGR